MTTPALDHLPRAAPAGSPNVLVILFDDLGFAQLGCYGSDIDTPHLDGLAAGGLRYNRFHVTAICSPSRAALLTGRNHHAVGMGFLADLPLDHPGYCAHRPPAAGTLPRILTRAGYNAYAVGKWHLTPGSERSHSGPFDSWPLGWGFERYYGFLQGDTNQWTPNLVRDNHYVDPPRSPEQGYHLSEDLADTAITYLHDQHQAAPGKPWFLYLPFGAMHAPHHVTLDWVEPYRGRFDDGWEAFRERAFEKQRASGLVPDHAVLTHRPPWVAGWGDLDGDARRLFARMQETFAGFLTHTDAQIGRVLTYLRDTRQLDNTIVLVMSDNGASAEGGTMGTVNEHRFTHRLPETVEASLRHAADWGGFRTYSHYSWGWAWAGNTPFHLWKRYTWLGGTRSPLIVHWPHGISDRGGVRDQMAHIVDVLPTVLDACGVALPDVLDGIHQQRVDGGSLAASFTDPAAPSPRQVQYFEMLGSRSIIRGEWKATSNHVSQGVADEELLLEGSRDFATDEWRLFKLDSDFAEANDVASAHPEVVAELDALWTSEAERNNVLPMKDNLIAAAGAILFPAYPRPGTATYRPGGTRVRDESIPLIGLGGGTITARVEVPPTGAEGVLCALGDWSSGFALYAVGGRPALAVTIGSEQTVARSATGLSPGPHEVSGRIGAGDAGGTALTLSVDGEVVAEAWTALATPFAWQHGGTAFNIGDDHGFPVSDDYTCPFPWTGGLVEVEVESAMGAFRPTPATVAHALHAD